MINPTRDNRSESLRGLLKNSKISKLFNDALASPIGSTDRRRAQKILAILKKTGNSMDGSGGPGPRIPQQNLQLQHKAIDYSNFVIFPGTPRIRVPIGSQPPPVSAPVMDGAGGSGLGSLITGQPALGSGTYSSFGTPSTAPKTSMYGPTTPSKVPSPSTGYPTLSSSITQQPALNKTYTSFNTGGLSGSSTPATSSSFQPLSNPYAPIMRPQGSAAATPSYMSQPGVAPGAVSPIPQTGGGTPPVTGGSGVPGGAPGGTSNPGASYPGNPGGTTSDSPLSKYPGIQAAVDSGMGSTMFAYQSMGKGADYLKTLPGFDMFSTADLNASPFLAERNKEISDSLWQSNHLDELLGELKNKQIQSLTLTGDLTDYIRGRDQFLNQTDSMLEKFKDQTLTMNMADPEIRSGAEMYSTYLYTLRGRQNKRYVEFLDMAVKEHEANVKAVETNYTFALNKYDRELADQKAITAEKHALMFGALTEMYNNVKEAPQRALEMQKLQTEIYATQMKAVKDAADAAKAGANIANSGETLKKMKEAGIVDANNRWVPNQFGLLSVPAEELPSYLGQMIDTGAAAMKPLKDKDGKITTTPSMDEIMSIGGNIMSQIDALQAAGKISLENAKSYKDQIRGEMASATYGEGHLSVTVAPTAREAIQYLSGIGSGWWGKAGGDTSPWPFYKGSAAPSRAEFLTAFKGQGLDDKFLDMIYTDFEDYTASHGGDRKVYAQEKLNTQDENGSTRARTDEELVSSLADNYMSKAGLDKSAFNTVGGDTNQASNRPQTNNNPLNIKASSTTSTFPGVVGFDPKPAADGGQFLVFNNPQSGMEAAKSLLLGSGYKNLTVNQALARWSGGGYGGEIIPALSNAKVGDLSPSQLNQLIATMAQREGYYA